MEALIEFAEENIRDILNDFLDFRKCYGLITAYLCHLPIVTNGFILTEKISDKDIHYLQKKYGQVIMCRADTKFNHWGNISRGKDLIIANINIHYDEIGKYSNDFILLCFQHPSLFFTNQFVERWGISGGINILILWNQQIIIEYVGKGFDVGDLSRGVNKSHMTIIIQWEMRNKNIEKIWESSKIEKLSHKDFLSSRDDRIRSLLKMGYENNILNKNIPDISFQMTFDIFKNIYKKCVSPVINRRKLFTEEIPITLQINMYNNETFHVFEIWEANS
jgi:hypothetical protein